MELKVLKCPNCGANTTNAQNCEYCGSLLVRFVDKGIDLSKTSYTNDSATFPGLAAELKRNLQLQEKNPEKSVITDLNTKKEDTGYSESISILRSGKCCWSDDQDIDISDSKNGLIITTVFHTYIDVEDDDDLQFNQRVEKQLEAFKKLDSFPLFTSHICNYTDQRGYERYGREYAIDFGNDAEGAARLISEILQKVYGWTMGTNFDMYTEAGHDIQKARDSWNRAHGFAVDEDDSTNSNDSNTSFLEDYWWVIAGLIGWFLIKMIF